MRYLPHTPGEVRAMLDAAGRGSIDELFETIPPEGRFDGQLALPPPMSEPRLMKHMAMLARDNAGADMLSFIGCGAYAHHIPPAVDQLLLRSEFYTAYTPYQPEVAQGTLMAIWEFQTLVSELYGLPLANASLYDGGSAAAEGVLMARRLAKRDRVVMSACVHPQYRETVATYLAGSGEALVTTTGTTSTGEANVDALVDAIDEETGCVLVGYPSYLGPLADLSGLADACHEHGALLVVAVPEPYALALVAPPGDWGADIVVGEGQPLACGPQFGGPGVGLLACRDERRFLQQLPGRVCGETVDKNGKRGFVLTLSTREQHIRRERATSNICTNQGLMALAMTIRLALLGKTGFIETANQCLSKAHYLRDALIALPGIEPGFHDAPFFNEFAIRLAPQLGTASDVLSRLEAKGLLGGVDLGRFDGELRDRILLAVTEQHTREDLDTLVSALSTL